jgi:hypothetical protein
MGALVAIFWIGMIGTGIYYYWFRGGRVARQTNLILGSYKIAFAAVFWPIYLIFLLLNRQAAVERQGETDAAKKRILG